MSKPLAALALAIIALALRLAWVHSHSLPVPASFSSDSPEHSAREALDPIASGPADDGAGGRHQGSATLPTENASANPTDRVAAARARHGAAIRERFHAVAVEYPGELFLRWFKREAVVELWARNPGGRFRLVTTYPILASSGGPGPKRREGDRQTPEGFYEIDRFNPASSYHLSLGLNYPNTADRLLANAEHPGSDIFIHGGQASIGCAALGDDAIEELYLAALDARAQGQARIEAHIFPGRMNGADWNAYAAGQLALHPELGPFWAQLQPAYNCFEAYRRLPAITVAADGRYVMEGFEPVRLAGAAR